MSPYPHPRLVFGAALLLGWSAPAFAQRYAFERSFDTSAPITLDVYTNRGSITVTTGAADRVVVHGTVTVRLALGVPVNAVELAQRLATNPPVQRDGDRVQLRPPSDAVEDRAVTIAYELVVPPETRVIASSNSGALSIVGVRGPVTAHTQSAALTVSRLGGAVEITTGSGAVDVDGVGGPLDITTSSSAIRARRVESGLRVKTGSGAVSIESTGTGDLDITTSSSAITVEGATRGVRVRSGSGHIVIAGRPGAAWSLSNSSGGIDVTFGSGTAATLDAVTRSGSIHVTGLDVAGTQARQRVQGAIGAGGAAVEITNSSGTIDLRGR